MTAVSDEGDPELLFTEASRKLVASIDAVFEGWVVRCVLERLPADIPKEQHAAAMSLAREAAVQARNATVAGLEDLLSLDVEEQAFNPLMLLRESVRYATAVLDELGAEETARDEFTLRAFPDDRYGLSPAKFGDIDESLHEVGLYWGAAKAHLVLSRRRPPH